MISRIDEKYGIIELKVRIGETKNPINGVEKTRMELWQITNNGSKYRLGTSSIFKRYISAKDLIKTLENNYNVVITRKDRYTDMSIVDRPQEVLDWLMSIMLIYELANS